MDIQRYLKTIDIDYRVWSRKVEDLESKEELNENEQGELDAYRLLLKDKEEQITLKRDD